MGLKICVRDSYEMLKSLERFYDTVIGVPLVCWDNSDTSLLMRLHPNHLAAVS